MLTQVMLTESDHNVDPETRESIEKAGSHLYGLLHARYILTSRGLQKMV